MVGMLTIYNYDSPAELVTKGEDGKLKELLGKMYYGKEVQKRYNYYKAEGGKLDLFLSRSGRAGSVAKVSVKDVDES